MKKLFFLLLISVIFITPAVFADPDAAGGTASTTDAGCTTCPHEESKCADCSVGSPASADAPKADAAKAPKESTLTVDALDTLIKSKSPMVILDARAGKFDDGKRIPGAKSLNAESTPEQIAAVLPSKEMLIVTYCVNPKCNASPKLATKLREIGYSNVMEVPEGIEGWAKAGKSVETSEKK